MITPLNKDTKIIYKPYIDAGVTMRCQLGWKILEPWGEKSTNEAFVTAQTFKTHFEVTTFMQNSILENERSYFAIINWYYFR
jgi:maltose phosphorylase